MIPSRCICWVSSGYPISSGGWGTGLLALSSSTTTTLLNLALTPSRRDPLHVTRGREGVKRWWVAAAATDDDASGEEEMVGIVQGLCSFPTSPLHQPLVMVLLL